MFVTFWDTVTPQGSEAFIESKNHLKVGSGTPSSSSKVTSAEHLRVKLISPAVLELEPDGSTVTGPMSTEIKKKIHIPYVTRV